MKKRTVRVYDPKDVKIFIGGVEVKGFVSEPVTVSYEPNEWANLKPGQLSGSFQLEKIGGEDFFNPQKGGTDGDKSQKGRD